MSMTVGQLCEALDGLDSDMEVVIGVETMEGGGQWDRFEELRFARVFRRLRTSDEIGEPRVVLFS